MKIETDFTSQEIQTALSLLTMATLQLEKEVDYPKEEREYHRTIHRKLVALKVDVHMKERKEATHAPDKDTT